MFKRQCKTCARYFQSLVEGKGHCTAPAPMHLRAIEAASGKLLGEVAADDEAAECETYIANPNYHDSDTLLWDDQKFNE